MKGNNHFLNEKPNSRLFTLAALMGEGGHTFRSCSGFCFNIWKDVSSNNMLDVQYFYQVACAGLVKVRQDLLQQAAFIYQAQMNVPSEGHLLIICLIYHLG